jgi:hypothetical protein
MYFYMKMDSELKLFTFFEMRMDCFAFARIVEVNARSDYVRARVRAPTFLPAGCVTFSLHLRRTCFALADAKDALRTVQST